MALSIQDIQQLLVLRGTNQYGREAVSQLEHALQCAHLAEVAGESDELIVACLLHDLGHMLKSEPEEANAHKPDQDDLHQYKAIPFLRPVLPETVLEPIRLHVDAKRYLCYAQVDYFDSLSAESVRSLALQGGIFTSEEASTFLDQAHAKEAVRLRLYDDLAKVAGHQTPLLAHYLPRLERLMLQAV
jgi:phosphonate degradation associated HDIG domain protein